VPLLTVQQAEDLRERHSVTGTQALWVLSEHRAVPYGTTGTGSEGQAVCNRNTGLIGSIGTPCCTLGRLHYTAAMQFFVSFVETDFCFSVNGKDALLPKIPHHLLLRNLRLGSFPFYFGRGSSNGESGYVHITIAVFFASA
jgi:hypothetical protein